MKTTVIKAGEKIQAKLEEIQKIQNELHQKLEKLSDDEIDELENDPEVEAMELKLRKLMDELW